MLKDKSTSFIYQRKKTVIATTECAYYVLLFLKVSPYTIKRYNVYLEEVAMKEMLPPSN